MVAGVGCGVKGSFFFVIFVRFVLRRELLDQLCSLMGMTP